MSTTGLESRIPPDYRHVAKLARPAPRIDLAGSTLKWYDVARATAPVPDEIRALARAGLEEAARRGGLALADDVGFVILHLCGRDFHFLLVCTWRNQNEVWETVFAKDGDADPRSGRGRPKGRTGPPSASGSSASWATSSGHGRATYARTATPRPCRRTSRTASTGRCSGGSFPPLNGGVRVRVRVPS
jgi:hypothetical protein